MLCRGLGGAVVFLLGGMLDVVLAKHGGHQCWPGGSLPMARAYGSTDTKTEAQDEWWLAD